MSKRSKGKTYLANEEATLLQARYALSKIKSIRQNNLNVLTHAERINAEMLLDELKGIFDHYEVRLRQIEDEQKQQQRDNEERCKNEGHVGIWKETTRYEDGYFDHQIVKNMPYKVWYRICTRCGATEETRDTPKEILDKEKRAKIQKLQEEIRELESELDE